MPAGVVALCIFIAAPGAMMRATACWPSSARSPAVLELIVVLVDELVFRQVGPTTYQRGSALASRNFSVPIVRHGKRPMDEQLAVPYPGLATPMLGPEAPSLSG